MDIALLVLRLVIGLLLIGHGAQKLLGWFGGHGIAGTGAFFETLGFRPGKLMALLAGLGETVGGLLLALGLLSPLGAGIVVAVMLNATVPHWGKGPFVTNGGWELAVTYAVIGGVLAFTGPGTLSLDNAFDWNLVNTGWGVAAVLGGLLAGGLNIAKQQLVVNSAAAKATAQPA